MEPVHVLTADKPAICEYCFKAEIPYKTYKNYRYAQMYHFNEAPEYHTCDDNMERFRISKTILKRKKENHDGSMIDDIYYKKIKNDITVKL